MDTSDSKPVAPRETEVDRLKRELAEAKAQLEAAHAATAAAASVASQGSASTEVDAGVDEDGNQTWWYTINLPPSGGVGLVVNGMQGKVFYHGERYRVFTATLQSLKEMVYRAWQQEDLIHGSNENFYRQQNDKSLTNGRRVSL